MAACLPACLPASLICCLLSSQPASANLPMDPITVTMPLINPASHPFPPCTALLVLPAAALHVWKTVVTNTPKTLGELLPALMAIIIESLADPGGWGVEELGLVLVGGWLVAGECCPLSWQSSMKCWQTQVGAGVKRCWSMGAGRLVGAARPHGRYYRVAGRPRCVVWWAGGCWLINWWLAGGWVGGCWMLDAGRKLIHFSPAAHAHTLSATPLRPAFPTNASNRPCAGEDRRDMAGRCLGELVRKMGDRILSQIIPILRQGMASPEATTRQVSTAQRGTA
jgi:hypothetical protein